MWSNESYGEHGEGNEKSLPSASSISETPQKQVWLWNWKGDFVPSSLQPNDLHSGYSMQISEAQETSTSWVLIVKNILVFDPSYKTLHLRKGKTDCQ